MTSASATFSTVESPAPGSSRMSELRPGGQGARDREQALLAGGQRASRCVGEVREADDLQMIERLVLEAPRRAARRAPPDEAVQHADAAARRPLRP